MSRVGIVADDLTGANDTAVQFAREGWPTLLSLRPALETIKVEGVLAVCTDARALGDRAAGVTAAAVERLRDNGVDQLYLKLDSTLRGSVAQQVQGALDAWSTGQPDAFAVVCPAYPAMDRVVTDGTALAGGRRLEDGPAGRDPVTPVRTSRLDELLPGSVHVTLPPGADAATLARLLAEAGARARVLTVDARDDADLARVADAVAALGPRAVPAGSAGLALALAPRWRPDQGAARQVPAEEPAGDGPVLALVTSLHQVAREQEQKLREAWAGNVLHLAPTLGDLLDEDRLAAWQRAHLPVDALPDLVVVTAPATRAETGADAATTVARALADVVAGLHAAQPARAVVVTGGDGARALVDRWQCTGISVHGAVDEGVPYGVLVGGQADGLPITTKAGGFGHPDSLVRAVRAAGPRHS